jgi:hypothetical protein
MKQLTKALLLAIGFLPLVSFADGDCSKIDLNTISKDYKILKCANNDLYTYADPNDKTNTPVGFIGSFNYLLPATEEQGRLSSFNGGISQAIKKVNGVYKAGLVNTDGDLIVPHIYDMAFSTSQGDTVVAIGDFSDLSKLDNGAKWGVIDNKGKILVPIIYDNISTFGDEGVGFLTFKMKYGFIDLKGKIIATTDYDKIELSPSKQTIKAIKNGQIYQFSIK